MATEKGYVYILTNDAFKDDWVKIGMTARKPDVRSAELDNTAVPIPYNVYATLQTSMYKEAEKFIHRMIDRLTDLRIRPNREFFNISPEEAYGIFEDIAKLFSDAVLKKWEKTKYDDDEEKTPEDHRRNRAPTQFKFLGIKPGTMLVLRKDPSKKCKVIDDRNRVEYEGDIYTLSAWASKLMGIGVNGFCEVYVENTTRLLWDLRKDLEAAGKYGDDRSEISKESPEPSGENAETPVA